MKKKGRGSIKIKLIGIILPVIMAAIVLLIGISYSKSRGIITDKATTILTISTKDQVDQMKAWLSENLAAFQAVKTSLEGTALNEGQLKEVLDQFRGYNSNYPEGLYIADEEGRLIAAEGSGKQVGADVSDSIWFREGMTRIHMDYGSAYQNEEGKNVISASALFLDGSGKTKVMAADLTLDKIGIIVNSKIQMKDAQAFLVDRETGVILSHRDNSLVSTKLADNKDAFMKEIAKKIEDKDYDAQTIDGQMVTIRKVDGTDWALAAYVPESSILAELIGLRNFMIVLGVVFIVILIILTERVIHIVIKPVKKLTNTIVTMGSGDFTVDVKVKGNDEISVMSESVKSFIQVMRDMIKDLDQISNKMNRQAEASNEISGELFDASSNQSASMGELNHTVDELSQSVNVIAENATTLASVVADTKDEGEEAGSKMQATVSASEQGRRDMQQVGEAMDNIRNSIRKLEEAIGKVGSASDEITGIVNLIGEIAEETNLLSLNASIEAARAGEAGRGFAVVAGEIGKLAKNSADSVTDITSLINEITRLVADAVSQSQESSAYINESSDKIHTAFNTFDTIFDNIQETNQKVDNMILKIEEVDQVATNMAAISEEQAASSEEILASSETMLEQAQNITDNSKKVAEGAEAIEHTAEILQQHVKQFKIKEEEA